MEKDQAVITSERERAATGCITPPPKVPVHAPHAPQRPHRVARLGGAVERVSEWIKEEEVIEVIQ
jgi:hypothetical protein